MSEFEECRRCGDDNPDKFVEMEDTRPDSDKTVQLCDTCHRLFGVFLGDVEIDEVEVVDSE